MRIALEASAITPNPSGIGLYVSVLAERMTLDPRVRSLRLFSGTRDVVRLGDGVVQVGGRGAAAGALRRLRERFRRSGYELNHGPNYFLPKHAQNGVVTVHDLSVLRFPDLHPTERVQDFERRFTATLNRATMLITDTAAIANEVVASLGVAPERVRVVPLAASERFFPRSIDAVSSVATRYGLQPGKYGLSVSTLEPRKRIRELVEAWSTLPQALRNQYPLVLCGADGWHTERFETDLAAAETDGWLKRTGYVTAVDLPNLYAGARLFVYPSLYEGFGLPPLEAMASGVPTIISDEPSLVEVAGKAACAVNPNFGSSFRDAIERFLVDDALHSDFSTRGLARAMEFSWETCVTRTIDVYSECIGLIEQ